MARNRTSGAAAGLGWMDQSRWLLPMMLGALAIGTLACNTGPDPDFTDYQGTAFPWVAKLGDPLGSTVAIPIDSNYAIFDGLEALNLHKERITVALADAKAGEFDFSQQVPVSVRSVFSLSPARTTLRHIENPGSEMMVVLVDLPSPSAPEFGMAPTYPFTAEFVVTVDGTEEWYTHPRVVITGQDGEPNPLMDETIPGLEDWQDSLEPKRMIRLRTKRGADKFNETQPAIAGVEFDFEYSTSCLTGVVPHPATEASNATATAGAPVPTTGDREKVRVLLVDPDGFDLVFPLNLDPPFDDIVDETLGGTGTFVDLLVQDESGQTCDIGDPAQFTFSDLKAVDVDGAVVVERTGALVVDTDLAPDGDDAVFRLYAVDVAGT